MNLCTSGNKHTQAIQFSLVMNCTWRNGCLVLWNYLFNPKVHYQVHKRHHY